MKFHFEIGDGHVDVRSFYRFTKLSIIPAPNYFPS
jgi:hypothetical protein